MEISTAGAAATNLAMGRASIRIRITGVSASASTAMRRVSSVGEHYNDRISSIRIFGRARVTIYKHTNYGGSHRTYTDDAPHLGDFNDEITAIEVR